LSFPMIFTVGYLGDPDWGVIFSSYLGSILMAGAYLGICTVMSAVTKNQVISFVLSVIICFVMVLLGFSVFNESMIAVLPVWMVDLIANFGFIPHFEAFTKGIIDPKDLLYFLSLIGFTLFINVLVLER
ncbi:MAG TPA: ABC transporter permease, partial [Opitutaceae bacterium]|nr:ABC transporter permease [Opitutaceae bacterium]